jgi:hypothetical protein
MKIDQPAGVLKLWPSAMTIASMKESAAPRCYKVMFGIIDPISISDNVQAVEGFFIQRSPTQEVTVIRVRVLRQKGELTQTR